MKRSGRRTANLRLSDLPDEREIAAAIQRALTTDPRTYREESVTANILAQHLGIESSRRLGRGAVKGSWSGQMAPGLRLAPRLASMANRGLVERWRQDYRWRYALTTKGAETLL